MIELKKKCGIEVIVMTYQCWPAVEYYEYYFPHRHIYTGLSNGPHYTLLLMDVLVAIFPAVEILFLF